MRAFTRPGARTGRRMEDSRRFAQTYIENENFSALKPMETVQVQHCREVRSRDRTGTGREDCNPQAGAGSDARPASNRKNIKTALAVLIAVDVVTVVVLLSPLVGSTDSRRMELNELVEPNCRPKPGR